MERREGELKAALVGVGALGVARAAYLRSKGWCVAVEPLKEPHFRKEAEGGVARSLVPLASYVKQPF